MAQTLDPRPLLSRLAPLASAIPYFLLAYTFVRVWRTPLSVDGGSWVPFAVGLMVLEFILLHSGAFMGSLVVGDIPRGRKVLLFLGMVAMYGLFALGFSLSVGSWAIMKVYAFLMAGRYLTVMFASPQDRPLLLLRSGVGVVFYLGAVFLTLFIPVPEGGLDHGVLEQVYPNRGSGVWERQPEVAIAAGVLYFTAMGVFELLLTGKRGDRWAARVSVGPRHPFEKFRSGGQGHQGRQK